MPLLLMIRHGENEFVKTGKLAGRLPDVHLNERGQKQAIELAESLATLPIKAVFSSPLERALETASPLANKFGLEVQTCDDLIETGVGNWSGQELKILRKQPEWKIVQNNPSRFRFPAGESFLDCQTRMVNAVENILKNYEDREIIACISHADPIKLLEAYYLGMPLDHFQRLACDTASISVLMINRLGVMMLKLNQRAPFTFPIPDKKAKAKK